MSISSKPTAADLSAALGVSDMSIEPIAPQTGSDSMRTSPASKRKARSTPASSSKKARREGPMRRLSVELPEELFVKLKVTAAMGNTSISALVRNWVDSL